MNRITITDEEIMDLEVHMSFEYALFDLLREKGAPINNSVIFPKWYDGYTVKRTRSDVNCTTIFEWE